MNKYKKLSKLLIVLFILCCFLFVEKAQAQTDYRTTVTCVTINGGELFDVEILQENDGTILIPVKQIADILEIPIKINHETKEISFENVIVNKNYVYKNGIKLSEKKNIFLHQGMMDEIKDEIFISNLVLSKIFNSDIRIDKNDLSMNITTDRKLDKQEINSKLDKQNENVYKAYSEVVRPKKKKRITLDTMEINNTMYSDSATQIYRTTRSNNVAFNNAMNFKFKGTAYNGDWELATLSNNYKDNLFSFSGLNFRYYKFYDGLFYEVGRISGIEDSLSILGNGVVGVQIYDYDITKDKKAIQDIEGTVSNGSLVRLYVNNELNKTLDTYDGYYSLADTYLGGKDVDKIELKELKENGEEKSIFVKDILKHKDKGFDLKSHEKRRTFLVGISGFEDRLFAQNGYFYQSNSKKLVTGYQEKYAINEKLIFNTSILYDNIVKQGKESIWAENIYNNSSILSMGTYKNPNVLEGITISNTLNWLKKDDLLLQSEFKMSLAKNIANNDNMLGYSGEIRTVWEKDNFKLLCGIYNQSPEFYQAGSRYGFISDRLGARIGGNFQYKDWGLSGQYNKYFSNTIKKNNGGIIDSDELNFSLKGHIGNFAQIRYQINSRIGENDFGKLSNTFQDLNLTKNFKRGFNFEGGMRMSNFLSEDNSNLNCISFDSNYSTTYVNAGYQIPNNKGKIEIGHDITEYSSNDFENKYNMFKIHYTFPEMKRFLISLGTGYKYAGMNKGFNYSASIGYRTKSGMVVSLMYRYDTDLGYLFDDIYIPTSQRHSINLVFNNLFAITPSGLKSVGQASASKGFVEMCAYLDKNENDIFDDGDVGVEDVPFKISNHSWKYSTKKNGKTSLLSTNKGIYKVEIDEEHLPCNLDVYGSKKERFEKQVIVKPKEQTVVAFKMISSVGNIKGNLKVIDDFGRSQSIKDFIVVINDKNGNEISYSTVDDAGNYYFSGIPSGEYIVKLDDNFKKKYSLENYEDSGEILIKVPYDYKNMVNIDGQNLIYHSL